MPPYQLTTSANACESNLSGEKADDLRKKSARAQVEVKYWWKRALKVFALLLAGKSRREWESSLQSANTQKSLLKQLRSRGVNVNSGRFPYQITSKSSAIHFFRAIQDHKHVAVDSISFCRDSFL